MTIVAYAPAIQEAIASGDLARMRDAHALAEQHMEEFGDVHTALEVLKVEIGKLERRQADL
jgi:hypothetical protein